MATTASRGEGLTVAATRVRGEGDEDTVEGRGEG
jgi:hypothetical protein